MGIPLLELRDVTYALNGKNILEHVSWTVRQGEHWAILGANGAGKTSLLKIVCGDLWPNRGGEVYRNGQDLLDLGVLRRSIGWVASTLLRDIPMREAVLDTVVSGKYAQLGLWRSSGEEPEAGDVAAAGRFLAEMGCSDLATRPSARSPRGSNNRCSSAAPLWRRFFSSSTSRARASSPAQGKRFCRPFSTWEAEESSGPYLRHPPSRRDFAHFYAYLDPQTRKGHERGGGRGDYYPGTMEQLYGAVALINKKGRPLLASP